MPLLEQLKDIDVRLFADRDNLPEAMAYVNQSIEAIPQQYRAQIYTGVYVLLNTLGKLAREEANA